MWRIWVSLQEHARAQQQTGAPRSCALSEVEMECDWLVTARAVCEVVVNYGQVLAGVAAAVAVVMGKE